MVYSPHYKIPHTFIATVLDETFTYTVLMDDDIVIHTGTIYGNGGNIEINLASIIRRHIKASYEDLNLNTNTALNSVIVPDSYKTITVESDYNAGNVDINYIVVYDYNTDYISSKADSGYLNRPIYNLVDPRQRIYLSVYNNTGNLLNAGWRTPSGTTQEQSIGQSLYLTTIPREYNSGDKFNLMLNSQDLDLFTVIDECPNRYALYYVNKIGGLDSLLLNGKVIINHSSDKLTARFYDDPISRQDFEYNDLSREIAKRYTLNTFFIDVDKAHLIDELICSNKVWIHNLEEDSITSCTIYETSYSDKDFTTETGLIEYTFNVIESQRYLRY